MYKHILFALTTLAFLVVLQVAGQAIFGVQTPFVYLWILYLIYTRTEDYFFVIVIPVLYFLEEYTLMPVGMVSIATFSGVIAMYLLGKIILANRYDFIFPLYGFVGIIVYHIALELTGLLLYGGAGYSTSLIASVFHDTLVLTIAYLIINRVISLFSKNGRK
jgi:hypothetical protein